MTPISTNRRPSPHEQARACWSRAAWAGLFRRHPHALIALVLAMVLRQPAERRAASGVAGRTDVADTRLAQWPRPSPRKTSATCRAFGCCPPATRRSRRASRWRARAEKTLDVQYYQIATTRRAGSSWARCATPPRAACACASWWTTCTRWARTRCWPPGRARRTSKCACSTRCRCATAALASRVVFSMHQFSRVNGRMHNKLFIADNVFSITGGRNIADEYFGRSEPANFIDMDMLSPGRWCASCRPCSTATGTASTPTRCKAWPRRASSAAAARRHSTRACRRWRQAHAGGRARPARPAPASTRNSPAAASSCIWPPSTCIADAPAKIDGVNATSSTAP